MSMRIDSCPLCCRRCRVGRTSFSKVGIPIRSPVNDLGDPVGQTEKFLQVELGWRSDRTRQQVAEWPPVEPGRPDGLTGIAGHQQPGRASAISGYGLAQLDDHRGLQQRQVLDLVYDDAVEAVESIGEVVVLQPLDGVARSDEFGKGSFNGLRRQKAGEPKQLRGGAGPHSIKVAAVEAVLIVTQPYNSAVIDTARLAWNRPTEEHATQFGMECSMPVPPGWRQFAAQCADGRVEAGAAASQGLPDYIGSADLAYERREVTCDDVDIDGYKRCEPLFGVTRQSARPSEVEYTLRASGFDCRPEHGCLAGAGAAMEQTDRPRFRRNICASVQGRPAMLSPSIKSSGFDSSR